MPDHRQMPAIGGQGRSRSDAAWLAMLFAVAAAIVCFARIRHTYFIFDDFLNFGLYVERGVKLKAYFFQGVFGQFVPGYRLAQALVYELFGPNNFATIVIISLMTGVVVGLAVSIVRRLSDDVWLQVLLGTLFAFTYQQLDAQLWWASSLHTFPGLIAALTMIRLLLGEGRRASEWAALALFCGLSFYSKTLFSLIFAFGLLVALSKDADLTSAVRTALWKMRYTILVAALYAATVTLFGPRLGVTNASIGAVLFFLWQSLSDASLAATLGLGSHGSGILGRFAVVPGFAVLIVLIIWSVRMNGRQAAFAWLGLAAYFVASMSIIGIARSGPFPEAGLWPRYSIENVVFLLLTIAVAFRGHSIPAGVPRAVSTVGAAALAVLLQVQSSQIYHPVSYAPIRNYVETLRGALAALPQDAVIADTELPDFVMGGWMAPTNRMRFFVPIYTRHPIRAREQATVEVVADGTIKSLH